MECWQLSGLLKDHGSSSSGGRCGCTVRGASHDVSFFQFVWKRSKLAFKILPSAAGTTSTCLAAFRGLGMQYPTPLSNAT